MIIELWAGREPLFCAAPAYCERGQKVFVLLAECSTPAEPARVGCEHLGDPLVAARPVLRLAGVEMVDGVPVSTIVGRYNLTTMRDKLPYGGEVGADYPMVHEIELDGQTRFYGRWTARGTVMDSETAPVQRESLARTSNLASTDTVEMSATIAGDEVIQLSINGTAELNEMLTKAASELGQQVATATGERVLAQDAAAEARGLSRPFLSYIYDTATVGGATALTSAGTATGNRTYFGPVFDRPFLLEQVDFRAFSTNTAPGALHLVKRISAGAYSVIASAPIPIGAIQADLDTVLKNTGWLVEGGYLLPAGYTVAIFGADARMRQTTLAGGVLPYVQGNIAGDNVAVSTTNGAIPQIRMVGRVAPGTYAKVAEHQQYIDSLKAANALTALKGVAFATPAVLGVPEHEQAGAANAGRTNIVRTATEPFLLTGIEFEMLTGTGSVGAFKLLKEESVGIYSEILSSPVAIAAGGNVIPAGTGWIPGDGYLIPAGCAVAVYTPGDARMRTKATGRDSYYKAGVNLTGSNQVTSLSAGVEPQIRLRGYTAPGVAAEVRELAAKVAALPSGGLVIADALRGSTVIVDQVMKAGNDLPAAWRLNGWTQAAAGIVPPATRTGWGATAYFDADSAQDRKTIRMRATVHDANAVFGLRAVRGARGSTLMVDGQAGTLTLYADVGGETDQLSLEAPGTPGPSVLLPAGFLVAGHEYLLEMKRVNLTIRAFIRDTTSQVSVPVSTAYTGGFLTMLNGGVGVVAVSGNVTVSRLTWIVNVDSRPFALWFGDSITDGVAIRKPDAPTGGRLIEKFRGRGDMMTCGKSGDRSSDILSRLQFELTWATPRYVVILAGANDGGVVSWETNMKAMIAAVEAKGSIPVLVTTPPRNANTAAMNDRLRNSPDFAKYTLIDLNKAVTLNHDMTTWDDTLHIGDGVHPNEEGHLRYSRQIEIDAPFLLDNGAGLSLA
ncbi:MULTISPECIES: SGNH/GDSL hydrolase family protein [Sphingomonas]|uniref:SGNH/GDSL hydrolase family protein n=1 Tax=Sphingomonas molluscorum TaxID=418184 RepID=A0ABU8Q341_9SPHN|nr:SGNH/GDSL hydrolase family protein [Sphingomonas sp. JUb134]MBM7405671.1 lysophospholipase L1-like esterase [Sphingomonas sp. JUb134]